MDQSATQYLQLETGHRPVFITVSLFLALKRKLPHHLLIVIVAFRLRIGNSTSYQLTGISETRSALEKSCGKNCGKI